MKITPFNPEVTINNKVKAANIKSDNAYLFSAPYVGNKKAIGATAAVGDRSASVVIDKRNTLYYLNTLFFTMTDMKNDTRNEIPRTEIRIYGEFIGSVIEDDRRRAAIIDGEA